jgi:hypothetical protein
MKIIKFMCICRVYLAQVQFQVQKRLKWKVGRDKERATKEKIE